MPQTIPLASAYASVTFNGSGAGTAKVGPLTPRERWNPANVHVSASSAVNEAQCLIYVGSDTSPQNFRDGTISGSTGDATDRVNADIVLSGQFIWAVWTGGDAGAVGTMTVTGTKDVN